MEQDMNDRTCIVTRESGSADDLIRFVAGPDGSVVPDLKRTLPGGGAGSRPSAVWWMKRSSASFCAGAEGRCNAAGGSWRAGGPVADEICPWQPRAGSQGRGCGIWLDQGGSGDPHRDSRHGVARKGSRRRRRTQARSGSPCRGASGWSRNPFFHSFYGEEMDLAFGGGNVIHAAVLEGKAAAGFVKRALMLHRYRGESASDPD